MTSRLPPNIPGGPGAPGAPQTGGQGQGPAFTLGQQQFNYGSGLLNNPVAGNGFGKIGSPVAGNSWAQGGSNFGAPNGMGQAVGMIGAGLGSGGGFNFGGGGQGGAATVTGAGGPRRPQDMGSGYGIGRNAAGQQGTMGPQLNPTAPSNPWLQQQGQGIMNQTNQMLGQNLLGIQGNSVASGGLGGSRQGVAQGTAMGQASNYLSANLADMYGGAYESDANRNMQKYGIDTQSYLGQRGQDINMRGQDMDFYQGQRGQDLQQAGLGSDLINRGLQTQWLPLNNAANLYNMFQNNGTTTNTQKSGGGWQGAVGGGLGAYQYGSANGWW
jgi:hypothetical protein